MSEENVVVKMEMSKEAIKAIESLKDKMNVSTESEVIRNAISLLTAVEEGRDTIGNIVIPTKNHFPGPDKAIDLPWD
jgi:hypothetical protein